jgi:hypothetical protein
MAAPSDHRVDAERRKEDATDLFAGEWTQDLSKTRLRQGMALKIERMERRGPLLG